MNLFDYDIVMGIDIGLGGAIAIFDTVSGELLSVYDMPTSLAHRKTKSGKDKYELDIQKLKFILEIPRIHQDACLVVIEDVHGFPGQGVVSSGTLMEQKGVIRGMAYALGYAIEMVNPKTWQAFTGILPPKTMKNRVLRKSWIKDSSRKIAQETFPGFVEYFCNKPDHGRSDAALIGRWKILAK